MRTIFLLILIFYLGKSNCSFVPEEICYNDDELIDCQKYGSFHLKDVLEEAKEHFNANELSLFSIFGDFKMTAVEMGRFENAPALRMTRQGEKCPETSRLATNTILLSCGEKSSSLSVDDGCSVEFTFYSESMCSVLEESSRHLLTSDSTIHAAVLAPTKTFEEYFTSYDRKALDACPKVSKTFVEFAVCYWCSVSTQGRLQLMSTACSASMLVLCASMLLRDIKRYKWCWQSRSSL